MGNTRKDSAIRLVRLRGESAAASSNKIKGEIGPAAPVIEKRRHLGIGNAFVIISKFIIYLLLSFILL